MYNGVLNVYKEAGYTSFDVVAKLRGILKQKKIGHTGTLDPDALGVLPVCLGKATKLCDMLTDWTKTYEAELMLGVTTDTQDLSGRILIKKPVSVGEDELRACITSFVGEQMQIPPMYSALKVNGKKLYELAREGKTVERAARKVHFHQIEIQKVELPVVRFTVTCSKGTYIRTLCHDIGEKLGCGGAMKSLLRRGVGIFDVQEALTLEVIEALRDKQDLDKYIQPIDCMFPNLVKVYTDESLDKQIHNGVKLSPESLDIQVRSDVRLSSEGTKTNETSGGCERIRLYDSSGDFVGIYGYDGELYRPIKMFYNMQGV